MEQSAWVRIPSYATDSKDVPSPVKVDALRASGEIRAGSNPAPCNSLYFPRILSAENRDMSTPPRTAAANVQAGLRRTCVEAGPMATRKRARTHRANGPTFKLGNLPPNDPENLEPDLEEKGVVLAAPGYGRTGREGFETAWGAYNTKHLAHRPYPKGINPNNRPKKHQKTKRRRSPHNLPHEVMNQPGPNVRQPAFNGGGKRKRTTRRRRPTRR